MDFSDKIKQFAKRAEKIKDELSTEEATKNALIMPFFQLLDYDIFNPFEFVPEFTADVCSKKGEKVDYAIMIDNKPTILIEAKPVNDNLTNHDAQLYRYFTATEAKFAILTNGITYKFFTDLEEKNKMDRNPFFEFDILNIDENKIPELKKICRNEFDLDIILNAASELKYSGLIKKYLNDELQNPSDEFVRFIINGLYQGVKTQNVIEEFRPIVKKSFSQFVTDFMNEKFKTLLENEQPAEIEEKEVKVIEENENKQGKIITTAEELVGFDIVRNILRNNVENLDDITYKDVERYFSILYKGNSRKWICRLWLNSSNYKISFPTEDKKEIKHDINSVADILEYKDELIKVLNRYL